MYIPLNFSAACGLSLFLSGCHFSAALRYAFLISSCVAVSDMPITQSAIVHVSTRDLDYPGPWHAASWQGKAVEGHIRGKRT